MKSYMVWALLALIVVSATTVRADCEDGVKEDDSWFKKVGCQIKKGAEDTYQTVKKGAEDGLEAVKPLGDKIATSAKEFGSTVAKKYDEVKHKLTDDNVPIDGKPTVAPLVHEPTEKVPLAPLAGHAEAAKTDTAAKPTTGEQTKTSDSSIIEHESFDDRFLLQNNNPCPPGQALDHTRKHCRPAV